MAKHPWTLFLGGNLDFPWYQNVITDNSFYWFLLLSLTLFTDGIYRQNGNKGADMLLMFGADDGDHYNDVIMSAMASQIIGICMVCSNFNSDADQRKHRSSASLAFVRGIHRWPVNSPHKSPVTQKMFFVHLMTSSCDFENHDSGGGDGNNCDDAGDGWHFLSF